MGAFETASSSSISRWVSMNAAISFGVPSGIRAFTARSSRRAASTARRNRSTSASISDASSLRSETSGRPRSTTRTRPIAMPLEALMPWMVKVIVFRPACVPRPGRAGARTLFGPRNPLGNVFGIVPDPA